MQLFGQSAIRLLDGGLDSSKLPPNTFAAHFRQNGGSDLAEVTDLPQLLSHCPSLGLHHQACRPWPLPQPCHDSLMAASTLPSPSQRLSDAPRQAIISCN